MIEEKNLLFVISQPRSGSSLLQQLLLSTNRIVSIPEPWLMLSLTQVFRKTFNMSEFNPHYAYLNFSEYLSKFNSGHEIVREDIKHLILKLYNLNSLGNNRYFLDKTPRYYHILEEIQTLLPESKIIIILRNPVSVFASILDYNFKGDFQGIFSDDRLDDLYKAPYVFSQLLTANKSKNIFFMKYEDLVKDPGRSLNPLSRFLDLEYVFSDQPQYTVNDQFLSSNSVDRKGMINNRNINAAYLESWKQFIDTRLKKELLNEYLRNLGPAVVNTLGYNYNELLKEVQNHAVKFNFTLKTEYLLNKGNKIALYNFLSSRLAIKLNKLFNL